MKTVGGIFFTWEEVEKALKDVLDDVTIKVERKGGRYMAYSSANDTTLDMGQIDARLAQHLGWDCEELPDCQDRYVGYASSFGLILTEQKKPGDIWIPGEIENGVSREGTPQESEKEGLWWLRTPTKAAEAVVFVEGGRVEAVYSNDKSLEISVLDVDTDDGERASYIEDERRELQARIDAGEIHEVY